MFLFCATTSLTISVQFVLMKREDNWTSLFKWTLNTQMLFLLSTTTWNAQDLTKSPYRGTAASIKVDVEKETHIKAVYQSVTRSPP